MLQINKVKWTFGDQGKLRSSPTWLAKTRIKGNLEWAQYHRPGTRVRYLTFSRLPMTLNTTDKLRSRHTAVLKAPACPQEMPGGSHHLPWPRSCRHLEERLLTWRWITYNNVWSKALQHDHRRGQTHQEHLLGQGRDPNVVQDKDNKTYYVLTPDVCEAVITQNSKSAQVLTGKSDPLT